MVMLQMMEIAGLILCEKKKHLLQEEMAEIPL